MTTSRTFLTDEARAIAKRASTGRKQLLKDAMSYITTSAVKRAALGGQPDAGFEQSFASLAFTYVQEKAPALTDFMVGFQLVDRNEDNTKAVGIFGFKIKDQWAYVPVFFLNGNLKGHELLYLKNQDTFVPLKETWVNHVLSKKPHVLGEPSADTERELGIMQPNFNAMNSPPTSGKYAMYVPPKLKAWAETLIPKIGTWVSRNPITLEKFSGLNDRLDFKQFIGSDISLVKLAVNLCEKYPTVKAAMQDLYGPTLLRDILLDMKTAALAQGKPAVLDTPAKKTKCTVKRSSILVEAAATEPPKVSVKTDVGITDNTELTDSEREKLLRDGYLITDHRAGEEVSVAYNTQVAVTLVNPDSTGVYEVLVKAGEFKRCLIVYNPHGSKGRDNCAVVASLDGDKAYENIHPTRVFVKQREGVKSEVEEYNDWFKDVSDQKSSLAAGSGQYLLLTPNGQGTKVFSVREKIDDNTWSVVWDSWGNKTRPDYEPDLDHTSSRYSLSQSVGFSCETICFNNREGSSFKSVNGTLYVPPNAKVMAVTDPRKCDKCSKPESGCKCDYFRTGPFAANKPINPGNLADLHLQIMQKTAELKIWTDHNEVVINRQRMSKMAGLFHLVTVHGFREKQAKRMLKEAERFGGQRFRVKYAQPYATMEGPGAPQMPMGPEYGMMDMPYGPGIQSMEGPQMQSAEVPELSSSNTDPSVYDPMAMVDPRAMQVAQQAGQTGQRDVFDTAMISSMLRASSEDSIVERYLGDLIKSLDRIGRILLMFYWHNEEFMNRYGKQDMPELEDTLKNAFEVVGDLVIYLKEKTINPGTMGMNLGTGGLSI